VYIAGVSFDDSGYDDSGRTYACYWKNDVQTNIGVDWTHANDITVSGANMYIAGRNLVGTDYPPGYWTKDGWNTLPLTGTWGNASRIAVSGTDVYVVGFDNDGAGNDTACYWKNGTQYTLPITGIGNDQAIDIAISGSDVYIMGYSYGDSFNLTPCFWLNGELIPFPSITGIDESFVVGFALVDSSTD
jgi:hypothetical protein